VSNDGRTLYSVGNGTLQVTSLPSGKAVRTLRPKDVSVRVFDDVLVQSPDGRSLAVGAGVEAVVLDRATLESRTYLAGQGATYGLAFSPDSAQLAVAGDRLLVWDVSGPEPLQLLAQDSPVDSPAFSGDGQTVYAKHEQLVQAWDLSGRRRFTPAHPGAALGWDQTVPRFSPDRSRIAYVLHSPTRFRVRDVASGSLNTVVAPTMEQRSFIDIAWNPRGTVLNVTTGSPEVRIWDARTGKTLAEHQLGPPGSIEGAAFAWFSADGTSLLVSTTTGRLHVLDATTLEPMRAPIQVYTKKDGTPDPREISGFRTSGDNHTVYLTDAVVDYVSGAVRPFPDVGHELIWVEPSPDARRLMVATADAGVGLLDATTFTWIAAPDPSQAGLIGWRTAFSDDGSRVASVSGDGRLSFWDGRDGTLLGSLPTGRNGGPAFSADNRQLILAGDDGSVVTWDLDPKSWLATACRLAGRSMSKEEWHDFLPNRPFEPVCSA